MRGKVSVVSLTALMGLSCSGCGNLFKSDPDDYRTFQIHVDSVAVASPLRVRGQDPWMRNFLFLVRTTSPLAVTDTMRILFYGGLGGNTCYRFSHFDVKRIDQFGYNVSVWGKELRGDIACFELSTRLVPQWGREGVLELHPPLRVGTWIFLVSQPDGSILRKEAVVE